MRLYIANCSHQRHIVMSRLPEMSGVLSQPVEAGSQIVYGGDKLNLPQIEAAIKHLSRYGLRTVQEAIHQGGVVPLICSVDKPVSIDAIRTVIMQNRGLLKKRGDELRKSVAIEMSRAMESRSQEDPLAGVLDQLEVSVQEDNSGSLPTDDKPLNEGVRVVPNRADDRAPPPINRPQQKARRRRAA